MGAAVGAAVGGTGARVVGAAVGGPTTGAGVAHDADAQIAAKRAAGSWPPDRHLSALS